MAERTESSQIQPVEKENASPSLQIIVFKLGQEEYGLMIDQIKEVVITPTIAKVPLTPSYIKGVANIRGEILAIVDLEEKFGLVQPEEAQAEPLQKMYSLVVEDEKMNMAILVREVPNTLTVRKADIDESPNLIARQPNQKNYIKGIVKLADRIVILIDIYSVIDKGDITNAIQ